MSPQDCTGCDLCTHACPDKCLTGKPLSSMLQQEVRWGSRGGTRLGLRAGVGCLLAVCTRRFLILIWTCSILPPFVLQGPNWDFYRSLPAR